MVQVYLLRTNRRAGPRWVGRRVQLPSEQVLLQKHSGFLQLPLLTLPIPTGTSRPRSAPGPPFRTAWRSRSSPRWPLSSMARSAASSADSMRVARWQDWRGSGDVGQVPPDHTGTFYRDGGTWGGQSTSCRTCRTCCERLMKLARTGFLGIQDGCAFAKGSKVLKKGLWR